MIFTWFFELSMIFQDLGNMVFHAVGSRVQIRKTLSDTTLIMLERIMYLAITH